MTTDDSKAALAAALHERVCDRKYESPNHEPSHHGYECDAAAILAAMPGWRLVPADAVPVDAHEPGDPHQYRIECEVCGERGTIRITVDPETALAPPLDDIHGTPTFSEPT